MSPAHGTPVPKLTCPVCGSRLPSSTIRSHVGGKHCGLMLQLRGGALADTARGTEALDLARRLDGLLRAKS